MTAFIDLTAQRFGRLVVVARGQTRASKTTWECACDCGGRAVVMAAELRRRGGTKSCGCLVRENKGGPIKHGASRSPEHKIWVGIVSRCSDSNRPEFLQYGARGIKICERWRESFSNFLADMGPRPSPTHSIDRYPNNDGNYEPGNCRWATPKEQARNRRDNHTVTFSGRTMTLAEACDLAGLIPSTVLRRLQRGWSVDDALSQPAEHRYLRGRQQGAQRFDKRR